MANTTFTGPVRSENGFQSVTKNATTGAVTADSTFGDDTTIGTTSPLVVTLTLKAQQTFLSYRHLTQVLQALSGTTTVHFLSPQVEEIDHDWIRH